ncbi:hypothetical protein BC940DRAFT_302021 [Gongronella butleri]|nr:hypothetical protein BC940DRAFT_302021 [Gongronella butleri]
MHMPSTKQHKEEPTLSIELDDDFTGVLQGEAGDESEGCVLSGQVIIDTPRPLRVRRLTVWFEGRCKVHLRKASSYGMVASAEASETRSLFSKYHSFIGLDGVLQVLDPGRHAYYFSIDLPAHLPASFKGKRGYIRYRLSAGLFRPMFSSDIQVNQDITLKRCLLSGPDEALSHTMQGTKYAPWLKYSAKAPSIAYREGGLVRLQVALQLLFPELHRIKSVSCALRERVQYRTTDHQANTVHSRSDEAFPLGFSTFYPDHAPDYDASKPQDYAAVFRLIPRVNADTNSRLLRVSHSLVVNIHLEHDGDIVLDSHQLHDQHQQHQEQMLIDDDAAGYASDAPSDDIKMAPHDDQSSSSTVLPPHPTELARPDLANAASSSNVHHFTMTPPHSNPGSPTLSRSSSSSSITSLFSLKNKSHDDLVQRLEANKPNGNANANGKAPAGKPGPGVVICSLELPLVVTSRENYNDDGAMPHPPSYRITATEAPPGYKQTIDQLPPVPMYCNADATCSTPPCPPSPAADDH